MKKTLISALYFSIIASTLTISSCRKDNEDLDTTIGYEVGQFESMTNDVDNMIGQVWQDNGTISQRLQQPQSGSLLSGCAVVIHDTVANTIVIDFGNGCVGLDGRTRAGIINVSYTGPYFQSGSSHTITFDSFYVDTRKIEGTRQVINNGLNGNGNMNWTIIATNMKITRTDGYWRSWNSTRNREMTQGLGDNTWANDVYRINGTASGSNSNGNSYSMNISNVVRDNSCYWITAGTIEITPANLRTRTLDFGNGSCDDQATVTVGNQTRNISLR